MKKNPIMVGLLLFGSSIFTLAAVRGTTSPRLAVEDEVGVLNPATCGSSSPQSWCSGTEIGAWINAAFSACTRQCVVSIPPGYYAYTTTIVMTKPSQSLFGAGSAQTILSYRGSGDGILWQMKPFTVSKAGTLKGFTLNGTPSTLNLVHSGTIQGASWEDLVISGATGPSGVGVLLENTGSDNIPAWTERTSMRNVHIGASGVGNKTGLELSASQGGGLSWEYSELDVAFNVEAGQTGVLVKAGTYLTHSFARFMGNIDSTDSSTSLLTVNGTINASRLEIFAEAVNGSHVSTLLVGRKGLVNAQGTVSILATDAHATANLISPTVLPGGVYSVSPWLDLNYPGQNAATNLLPMIQSSYRAVSSDGTVIIAQAANLQGRLLLSWPNNSNRMALMIIDIACAQFDTVCFLSVPVNYAYQQQAVFTNPTIKLSLGSLSAPQLQVTIGNRNGASQNLLASWYGAAGESPVLFPANALGTGAVALAGIILDDAGNLNLNGERVTPLEITRYSGNSGANSRVRDEIVTRGRQTIFADDAKAGSAGHVTCWKAVGQIGYCSTKVSTTGTCTCN